LMPLSATSTVFIAISLFSSNIRFYIQLHLLNVDMNSQKANGLNEFNKKYSVMCNAFSGLFQQISSTRVTPWSFGMDSNGDICGIIKVETLDEKTLSQLLEVAKKHKYGIVISTETACYRIDKDGVTQIEPASGREYVNNQITRFRMNLISL